MNRRYALVAASGAAVIVALTGCSTASSAELPASVPASAGSSSSSSSSTTTPLVGTWQTAAIPAASFAASYRRAGGTPAETARFLIGYGKTARVSVRLSGTDWVLFEQQDNQAPEQGWSGTYTVSDSTVHATSNDGPLVCHIVYALTLSGETMRIRVVSDEPAANGCAPGDLLIQRALYETAPFQRSK